MSSGELNTKLRIIITSPAKNVKVELVELNITCKEYEAEGLSDAASESLLSKRILNEENQVAGEIDLDEEKCMIKELATACRGVPLLLSVFGKHLRCERNKESYREALDVLREGNLHSYLDEDPGKRLLFMYHKIENEEVKEAFLDICAFFHGHKWNVVVDIVDFSKLEDLRRRALVSKNGSGEVIVHDILRLMGKKEAKLSRFSNYKELSDALQDNSHGFGNVTGISLVNDNGCISIQSTRLEAMHQSLRVLMLGDWVTLDGPPCQRAFRNLRYLHVGDIAAFPFRDSSKLRNLKVFHNRSKPGMNLSDLPSSLRRISHKVPLECNEFAKLPLQNLISLKSFTVDTHQSVELPEELHLPASLVYLELRRCKNLPKDIGHLTALESLILDGSDLKCLPQGFGKLKKLKHLSMDYCPELAFLSEQLGVLFSLENLSFKDCWNLRALPESFGNLHIHKLDLSSLVELNKLPNSFGNMPLLNDLCLHSCYSLMSLPDSLVQLKKLETLNIIGCTKLSILPEDFGRLRYLKHVTVNDCHLLKELPHGFGALPALKTFTLSRCYSFVNLPTDFAELTSLEELRLEGLPLISRIPDGFGNLRRLRFLYLVDCFQLKILSDDFENMASLERLVIGKCPELDGTMMEKIVKLQHCYMAYIDGSDKLWNKWSHMQSEIEHPIAVLSGINEEAHENRRRAMRVALLNGKCLELNNNTDQLMETSSLLMGLEEGKRATVALILLPIKMQSHQHQRLQRFAEMARKTANTNGSFKLQIVCARKYVWTDQRPTPTEDEEREEGIRQIMLSLPKGSCAIPSAESKRVKIITLCCDCQFWDKYEYWDWDGDFQKDKLSFFMADVVVDIQGRKSFENLKFTGEDQISGKMVMEQGKNNLISHEVRE